MRLHPAIVISHHFHTVIVAVLISGTRIPVGAGRRQVLQVQIGCVQGDGDVAHIGESRACRLRELCFGGHVERAHLGGCQGHACLSRVVVGCVAHLCVCVCVCVCMHVCMHVYMYVYMYVHMYVNMCIYRYMCVCVCVCVCMCVCARACVPRGKSHQSGRQRPFSRQTRSAA